jgi:hypothetical protein
VYHTPDISRCSHFTDGTVNIGLNSSITAENLHLGPGLLDRLDKLLPQLNI